MKKVYVVIVDNDDLDIDILGIYTDENSARAAIKEHNFKGLDGDGDSYFTNEGVSLAYYYIREVEVDI